MRSAYVNRPFLERAVVRYCNFLALSRDSASMFAVPMYGERHACQRCHTCACAVHASAADEQPFPRLAAA